MGETKDDISFKKGFVEGWMMCCKQFEDLEESCYLHALNDVLSYIKVLGDQSESRKEKSKIKEALDFYVKKGLV